MKKEKLKYQTLSEEISRQINQGLYRPGDKIPSIRRMSKIKKLSINTVKQAYMQLENQGLIEIRLRSGHRVRAHWPKTPTFPQRSGIEPINRPATTKQLLHQTHLDMEDETLLQLGSAVPDPRLLPIKKLNQLLHWQTSLHPVQSVSQVRLKGCENLRFQLARYYAELGTEVRAEEIYITTGCLEGIYLVLACLCSPGATIAVEHPIYTCNLKIWEQLGLNIIEIPCHPVTGICLDSLEAILKKRTLAAIVVIPNFNNPLGSLMPDENKKRLVALAEKFDLPLIEDDVFGDLSFQQRPPVLKKFCRKGNVVTASSFTKSLAPAFRTGWLMPGKYSRQFEQIKFSYSYSTVVPIQLTLANYLESGSYQRYLRSVTSTYAANMERMAHTVRQSFPAGTKTSHPRGGMVLWIELPENCAAIKLYQLAKTAGISIMPGPVFTTGNQFANHIRLRTACFSASIEKAVQKIGALAGQLS